MPISDIPLLSMLRTRMHWHQERQRLLAENVANADTPRFRPRDLTPPQFDRQIPSAGTVLAVARTNPAHLGSAAFGSAAQFARNGRGGYEVRPTGNAVNLEEEMMKVAANQMDYQTATSLYSRSLGLFRTALGRR